MNRTASNFGQAVEMNKDMEAATREMLESGLNLAIEISKKEVKTEAEKQYLAASGKFHVLMMIRGSVSQAFDSKV